MYIQLTDIYPVIWLALLAFAAKPIAKHGRYNDNYLSKETGMSLRGFLALTILLHHISQKIQVGVLLPRICLFGSFAVSIFYFLSGYGLQTSFLRSKQYKNHFLAKRLSQIIVPYFFVFIVFWVMNFYLLKEQYTFRDIIHAYLSGRPIVSYSWYIISILSYYIMFYLLMVFVGKNNILMIVCACIWHLIYMVFCYKMHYSLWWYSDGHMLIVGMIWACYESQILEFFRKHFIHIFIPSTIILLLLYFIKTRKIVSGALSMLTSMIIPFFVIIFTICFLMKFDIRNKVLSWVGSISLSIYLVQGLPINGLRNNMIYVHNDFLWVFMVVALTVLFAVIVNYISKKILAIYSRCIKG